MPQGRALMDLLRRTGTVLLESQARSEGVRRSWLLEGPEGIIACDSPAEVLPCLRELDRALRRGLTAAGFISYEAGLALLPGQAPVAAAGPIPLLWWGLYRRPRRTDSPILLPPSASARPLRPTGWDLAADEHGRAVSFIRKRIAAGDVYQVNLTCRLRLRPDGDPLDQYLRLRRSHPVPYGAFIRGDGFAIVSQSPELFLEKTGEWIETRPMKGTCPRGGTPGKDLRNGEWLASDEKNRAENAMIVDLMRNDLGRVAVPGSVETFDLFRVEALPSVFQMTGGVCARVARNLPVEELLGACFPPGSVTGAPKVRAVQIIGRLEASPRRVYTGAIGILRPDGDLSLSVAIRTLEAVEGGDWTYGAGGGIVHDSTPAKEWREARLKSRFLTGAARDVELLETMLLRPDGSIALRDAHLSRMGASARELDYPFARRKAERELKSWLGKEARGPAIVRLRANRRGDVSVEIGPLEPPGGGGPLKVVLSDEIVRSDNPSLRHKTTARRLYDSELARARQKGFAEVLFRNERGELTEGAFTNVFLFDGAAWQTSPTACGLLPGLWRRSFMSRRRAREVPIRIEDLRRARRVVVGNSVRGALEVGRVEDRNGDVVFRKGPYYD